MNFKLQAPFKPTGDQPEAIRTLVNGVRQGLKSQVLLGATGTGKSLGYSDPVFIARRKGETWVPQVCEIGPWMDSLVETSLPRHWEGDTLSLDPNGEYATLSIDPDTCQVAMRPITALTRHTAPEKMYMLQTACGRSATLTGDHNVWVLRNGQLTLLETADIRPDDYLPVPEMLPFDEAPLKALDILPILRKEKLFVECPDAILQYTLTENRSVFYETLIEHGIHAPAAKLGAIRRNVRGRGIQISTFLALMEKTNHLNKMWDIEKTTVGGKMSHDRLPARIQLTPAFLRLIGYYIAEGNSQAGYFIIANRAESVRQDVRFALEELGIPFFVRASSDFQVSSTVLTRLLSLLCGSVARQKRLPAFWAQLSNPDLAVLLRAYFDGDGTVERANAITCTTASAGLASDILYALMRFGIWGRTSRRWKKATNSIHAGDWYYQVTISGQDDLQRFAEQVGFSLDYKSARLAQQIGRKGNSNVDLVPLAGDQLRFLRTTCGLTATQLGQLAGVTRSAVQAIELGVRRPQRSTLLHILTALEAYADGQDTDWRNTLTYLRGLCNVRWSKVDSVQPVAYNSPYVYDLTVPGAETFLAGNGGFFVHNTFSIASVIQEVQKPAIIMAHNKTLAAQLYAEFKEFFPENAVEYFVSYYDYYQPESYVPRHDLYIEKETDINEEIERLRLAATMALVSRKDVIIIASVSCIYGLGSPDEFLRGSVHLKVGEVYRRNALIRQLIDGQYERNDMELRSGTFRVRGETLEIIPAYSDKRGYRITFFGDEVERIIDFTPLTGEIHDELDEVEIYPAKHYITKADQLKESIDDIEAELAEQVKIFTEQGKLIEAQRIEQRARYDLEMLKEVGYCSGIENYSRHLDRRAPGTPPWTLIDFFPSDYLLIIDESHITVPQIRAMYNGDRSRKETLVEYGFRLPSALDNRPLKFDEFEPRMGFTIFTSATPGPYELQKAQQVAEQIIRPTGLVDPEVEIRPTKGQVDDLVGEMRQRIERHERVLITTLTKRMAEDLSEYLKELGMKVHYLHSEVETLERVAILRDLRLGVFDILVGINLLREGLDLPEVSLVAILDADKEGFLRSGTSLIQTIGRAARNVRGRVIMYADRMTDSMKFAIDETNRRRAKQVQHNIDHGIVPVSIHKTIRDITDSLSAEARERAMAVGESKAEYKAGKKAASVGGDRRELTRMIEEMEKQMKEAAKNLEFEKAAALRDEIFELKGLLADDEKLKPWERIKLLTGQE